MDDNVPPYNSYLVADALIKANKDFDFILLPNARHGYGRDNFYIMRRRWDYFVQHLLQSTPRDEYQIVIKPDPRLMEAQGGNLYVRNLPNKGCVFTIDLPVSIQ